MHPTPLIPPPHPRSNHLQKAAGVEARAAPLKEVKPLLSIRLAANAILWLCVCAGLVCKCGLRSCCWKQAGSVEAQRGCWPEPRTTPARRAQAIKSVSPLLSLVLVWWMCCVCGMCGKGQRKGKVLVVVVEAKPKSILVLASTPQAARRLGPAASPLPPLQERQDTRPGPQGSPNRTRDTRIQPLG